MVQLPFTDTWTQTGFVPVVSETVTLKVNAVAVVPVPGGGAVKLTVAEYLTPNGRSLHGRGVLPDVTVKTRLLVTALAVARNLHT